jgi:hypothetical protein
MGVFALARAHGVPVSLKAIGMPANGLDQAADLAVSNQYPNPRPLERAALRGLLDRAFGGGAPTPRLPLAAVPQAAGRCLTSFQSLSALVLRLWHRRAA